jgi:hypothetical protein
VTRATDAEALGRVDDLIHDRWFDVDAVAFDADRRVVTIPFDRPDETRAEVVADWKVAHRLSVPRVRHRLSIHEAVDMRLSDTERIGRYDFDRLTYDAEAGTVAVRTNIPLELVVKVERLNVSVESTGETVGADRVVRLGAARGG